MKVISSSLVWMNGWKMSWTWKTSRWLLNYKHVLPDGSSISPHVDPDVTGLLVDNEGLHSVFESLQTLFSAGFILMRQNEQRRGQQDQEEVLLPSVHHHRPGTDRQRGGVVTVRARVAYSLHIIWIEVLHILNPFFCNPSVILTWNTDYRPSLVHPALVIYSALGNRLVKETGSSFSFVLMIC